MIPVEIGELTTSQEKTATELRAVFPKVKLCQSKCH